MAQFAESANSDAGPQPPTYLEDVPRVLFAGDVSHQIGASNKWVHELVERGALKPAGWNAKWRHGQWEFFLVFAPEEVARHLRNKGRPRTSREPRQLRLALYRSIDGGRA